MMEWYPIETAPKDGTVIFVPGEFWPVPVAWFDDEFKERPVALTLWDRVFRKKPRSERVQTGGGWTAVVAIRGGIGVWANSWGLRPTKWMPLPPS